VLYSAVHLRKSPLRDLGVDTLERLQTRVDAGPNAHDQKVVLPRGTSRADRAAADAKAADSADGDARGRGRSRGRGRGCGRGRSRDRMRSSFAADAPPACASAGPSDSGGVSGSGGDSGAPDVKHSLGARGARAIAPAQSCPKRKRMHSDDESGSDDVESDVSAADSGDDVPNDDSDAEPLGDWEKPPERSRTRSASRASAAGGAGSVLKNSVVAALFRNDMVPHDDIQLSGDDMEGDDFDEDEDPSPAAAAAASDAAVDVTVDAAAGGVIDSDTFGCDGTRDCMSCTRCCLLRIDEAESASL
jgi:hypothetical protein